MSLISSVARQAMPSEPPSEASAVTDMPLQRTLRTAIGCVGIGLHSGAKVGVTLHPAEPGTGIRFWRVDLPGSRPVQARYDRVVDTSFCTTLAEGGVRIGTVEHLMAALAACEIDNARIEVSGPEIPIMDGSALPFVFLIECAGTAMQAAPRRMIEVLKPVTVTGDDKWARLAPADRFEIDCRIAFDHPAIGRQSLRHVFSPEAFKSGIAAARTFGFADEVEALRAHGLARGGSLKNAVVIGPDGVVNEEGLRFRDEFVRHKVLDTVGDLALAGVPLLARHVGHRAGHGLNNAILRALFADPTAWRLTGEPDFGPVLPPQAGLPRNAASA